MTDLDCKFKTGKLYITTAAFVSGFASRREGSTRALVEVPINSILLFLGSERKYSGSKTFDNLDFVFEWFDLKTHSKVEFTVSAMMYHAHSQYYLSIFKELNEGNL